MAIHPLRKEQYDRAFRKRTGSVNSRDPLVGFLYHVMRDHLPPGLVERLVREEHGVLESNYTNGHLARYAKDLAKRLRRSPRS